jgi:glutathione S-transferase
MSIEVTAFRWVPPVAQGYVRDLRVRWALEEAGWPYEALLVDAATLTSPDYRRLHPFGQVPAYRNEGLELFESGAIVLHLARKAEALAPLDEGGRARVSAWVIAALNTLEPMVQAWVEVAEFHAGEPWAEVRRPHVEARLNDRLQALSCWLDGKDYLEGRFTAGDLIMTTVLRELVGSGKVAQFPRLDAYRERCATRPAFERAMAAQLQTFRENEPRS